MLTERLIDQIAAFSDGGPYFTGCATEEQAPCFVYSLHSLDDMLYVGVAENLSRRLRQHRRQKSWWPEVEDVIADIVCCRRHALDEEAYIITNESPRYNIMLSGAFKRTRFVRCQIGVVRLHHSQVC